MHIQDQIVSYTHHAAAWSDKHSNVAFSWSNEHQSGVQHLQAVIGWYGTIIADQCLDWHLAEHGNVLKHLVIHRVFRPEKIEETLEFEDVRMVTTCAYPSRNALIIEHRVTNHSAAIRQLTLSYTYPGQGVRPDWEGPFPIGHFVSLEGEMEGSWSTLFQHREHGINYGWIAAFVAGMNEGASLEICCIADLRPQTFVLHPNETHTYRTVMAFGYKRGDTRKHYQTAKSLLNQGWTSADETQRLELWFDSLPPIAQRFQGNATYERMYIHAVTQLRSLFIQGDGGYTDHMRIPYTTKHGLAIAFFWDTAFSVMGALHFDAQMCQEAIEAFVNNVGPRGSMPGTLADSHRAGEGQAPIMSRAAWKVFEKRQDVAWLARVYETLAGYIEFWYTYHASARGIAKYYNAGQIADNDARFDALYGEERSNQPVDRIESPDLSSFMVVEMIALSNMAEALGKTVEAYHWRMKADQLSQQIVDLFFFEEDAIFLDVVEGTKQKFSGVITPNMFLPIWAGVPLPPEQLQRLMERHMLNPDAFFREYPFPSLAANHPQYDPNSYWRGRLWPHIVYMMIEALWRAGYHQEADGVADRLLEMFSQSPWIHECYNSQTGAAFDEHTGMGSPDYNWSLATVINLLLQTYKTSHSVI